MSEWKPTKKKGGATDGEIFNLCFCAVFCFVCFDSGNDSRCKKRRNILFNQSHLRRNRRRFAKGKRNELVEHFESWAKIGYSERGKYVES